MNVQNYDNHVQYYYPHHFVFYPVLLLLTGGSVWCIFAYPDRAIEFTAITVVLLMLGWLSFMLRQHYALGNQNRIVRLELRLRYYQLTHQRLEPLEQQLTFGQLAAARFASDEELPELLARAASEKLSPDAIKQSIRHWLPDKMRV